VAQGASGRLRPRIFLTFRPYKGGRSSAKRTGLLYPRRNPWYSLSEAESNSGHMVLSGVPQKKSPVTPPGIDPGTVRLAVQLPQAPTLMTVSRLILMRMRTVTGQIGRKVKTHFLFNNFLFRKLCCLLDNLKSYCRARQATDDDVAHAHGMLDN